MPKRVNTSDFFKYEVVQVTEYESKKRKLPGPAPSDTSRGAQALMDWNRNMSVYYIDGKSVKKILLDLKKSDSTQFNKIANITEQGHISFNEVDGLKKFFDQYLLCNIKENGMRDKMRDLALDHFIQSGLPHAADFLIYGKNASFYQSKNIMLRGTQGKKTRIDFIPLADGVGIKEQDSYHAASASNRNDTTELWKNSKLGGMWERYFVKVKCETTLTLSQNFQPKLTLLDLSLDVSDSRFHDMFDQIKVSFYEWIKEKLSSIMNKKGQIEPIVIYSELNNEDKPTRIDKMK